MVKLEVKKSVVWSDFFIKVNINGRQMRSDFSYTRKSSAIRGAKRFGKHFREPVAIYLEGELLCWMTPLGWRVVK